MTSKVELDLPFNDPAFAELCEELDIAYLGLFKSSSRTDQEPGSDVDLLVKFSKPMSLLDVITAELRLEEFLGKDVDLVPEGGLKPRVRPRVMEDLRDVYGRR